MLAIIWSQVRVLLCMKRGQWPEALHDPEYKVSTKPLKKDVATVHPVHLLVNTKAIYKLRRGEDKEKKKAWVYFQGRKHAIEHLLKGRELVCHNTPFAGDF